MIRKITTSILLVAALAGCGTTSSGQYAVVREEMRDPASKKIFVDACRAEFLRSSLSDRQNLAALAGVSVVRAPGIVCNRIARAIASGRMSHAEFTASGGDYSKWISVLKG